MFSCYVLMSSPKLESNIQGHDSRSKLKTKTSDQDWGPRHDRPRKKDQDIRDQQQHMKDQDTEDQNTRDRETVDQDTGDQVIEKEHMVFWRRLSKKLRDLLKSDETEEMKNKLLQGKNVKKPQTNQIKAARGGRFLLYSSSQL